VNKKYWEQRAMVHENVNREVSKMLCIYFPFLNNDMQSIFQARDDAMVELNKEFNVVEDKDENLHYDEG